MLTGIAVFVLVRRRVGLGIAFSPSPELSFPVVGSSSIKMRYFKMSDKNLHQLQWRSKKSNPNAVFLPCDKTSIFITKHNIHIPIIRSQFRLRRIEFPIPYYKTSIFMTKHNIQRLTDEVCSLLLMGIAEFDLVRHQIRSSVAFSPSPAFSFPVDGCSSLNLFLNVGCPVLDVNQTLAIVSGEIESV